MLFYCSAALLVVTNYNHNLAGCSNLTAFSLPLFITTFFLTILFTTARKSLNRYVQTKLPIEKLLNTLDYLKKM